MDWVYFLREGEDGPIKIGHSVMPERQRAFYQAGNPRRLVLLGVCEGGFEREQFLLRKHAADRVVSGGGTEWVQPTEAVLETVNAALAEDPGAWLREWHEDWLRHNMVPAWQDAGFASRAAYEADEVRARRIVEVLRTERDKISTGERFDHPTWAEAAAIVDGEMVRVQTAVEDVADAGGPRVESGESSDEPPVA